MKNDSIDDSILQSKISIERKSSSLPQFPFKLTDQDYQQKIEFIKNTLQDNCQVENTTVVEDEEDSRREFNSNFASLQSWFIRVSHKEKLSFVLELLNAFSVVLKRSTNLLIDILGPVPKDIFYSKTQYTFSKYDMSPLDNDRCLTNIPLAEAKTNSISWFYELEEKEQVRVIIILLNLSGSAITFQFYFKAVKYLDNNRKYDLLGIQEKLNSYKFYSKLMYKEEDGSIGFLIDEGIPEELQINAVSPDSSPRSSRERNTNPETKNLEVWEKSSSTPSKNRLTSWNYEEKLEEWENKFKDLLSTSGILKVGNINENGPPVIDMLQLLPISTNRYIYSLLKTRSRKHMRQVNRYWYKSSMAVHKEEHARRLLDQAIETLEHKLFKYEKIDLDPHLKYVNMKISDEGDDSLSELEMAEEFSENDETTEEIETEEEFSENDENTAATGDVKRTAGIEVSENTEAIGDIEQMDIDSYENEENSEPIGDVKVTDSESSLVDDLSSVKYSIQMIPDPNTHYPDMYPKNPYSGRYNISEICIRFDHTRCIAANHQWIAASDGEKITLRSMLTGTETKYQLEGHTGYVTVLRFHPSSNCLFSASCDTTIRTWDIYSRKITDTYSQHKSLITYLSVNDHHLASVSMDQTLIVFEIETGNMIWQYIFACSPLVVDLGWKLEVYVGVEDGSVFKTDLSQADSRSNPKESEITHAHYERVTCILFDEPFVITGGNDGYVRVWHFEHFAASALASFDHNGLSISGIGLSFMKVLTTSMDGILRIWDMYNSRLTRQIVVNIARTPILSMICLEIYDHTKVIINNEDSIKVIEFPFYWINFVRACRMHGNEEPERRNTRGPGGKFLVSKPLLRISSKHNLAKQCRECLLLRNAALPAVVKPRNRDKVTLKEVPVFSKALSNYSFLLFPRIIPGTQKRVRHVSKREISESNFGVLKTLWKFLPRSTKGFLPIYNPSKRTM